MPKMKTKKAVAKKVRVRQSGSFTIGHPSSRHNTGKKNAKLNRGKRIESPLSKSDERRLKTLI
ncbi:MAG: 50S ribosomal protein L35 [Mollicutes bacterium]|nr:50S ribosomal protein L35 [Mollicutes bacterium]